MATESFEERVEKACKDKEIPGVVFAGGDAEGKYKYEKVFGNRSLKDDKPDPLTFDSTMWLASCTKLVTTVAVIQCIEKGLLKLDDDVTSVLPELKDMQILKDFDATGEPVLVENTKTITLKHLLTHSSGLVYDAFDPLMYRYRVAVDKYTPSMDLKEDFQKSYKYPLKFAPGESWDYSVGIDWAGLMVERVSGLTLDEYNNKNIWTPLGVTSMTFFVNKSPEVLKNLVDMSMRDGGLTPFGNTANPEAKLIYTTERVANLDVSFCSGGAGSYGAPRDYQKLLHSLCSDDGKILKTASLDVMFQDHLTPAAKQSFEEKAQLGPISDIFGGPDTSVGISWGLGGMIYLGDSKRGRRAGAMNWGGLPNLIWFCDRKGGMSGIMGAQFTPPGDPKSVAIFAEWEKEIYTKAGKLDAQTFQTEGTL